MGGEWTIPVEDRLLTRREITEQGCWLYTGKVSQQGYGVIGWLAGGSNTMGAHLVAYRVWVGQVPEGYQVDHTCHGRDLGCPGGRTCQHRRCINPEHLEAVTHVENNARSRRSTKTHCAQGHEYTPENTAHPPSLRGQRRCKRCQAAQARRRRARAGRS